MIIIKRNIYLNIMEIITMSKFKRKKTFNLLNRKHSFYDWIRYEKLGNNKKIIEVCSKFRYYGLKEAFRVMKPIYINAITKILNDDWIDYEHKHIWIEEVQYATEQDIRRFLTN